MALTEGQNIESRATTVIEPEIVNAQTIDAGGLTVIGRGDAAIVANRGRAQKYANTADLFPVGFQQQQDTLGDTSASPIPRANIRTEDFILERVAVAGLAGDVTDMLKAVYFTDEDTLTFTEPAGPNMVAGHVIKPVDSSQADVLIFGMISLMLQAMARAGGRETILIGLVSGVSGGGYTAANVYTLLSRIKFDDVYGVVVEPLIGAGADLDINIEIGGVDVTGGVIPWVLADAVGAKKASVGPITAGGVGTKGANVGFDVVETVVSTGGLLGLYGLARHEPGQ